MNLATSCVLIYLAMAFLCVDVSNIDGCRTPQFVEIGKTGIISCSFVGNFYGVLWYNSTDVVGHKSIITYKESKKSGPGYISGEFDIYPNGSLVITNVSLAHERNYTVLKLDTPKELPTRFAVALITTVIPDTTYPVVEGCPEHEPCILHIKREGNLICTVRRIRPQIQLTWEGVSNASSTRLSIFNHQQTVTYLRNSYDVSLSSKYVVNSSRPLKLVAVCSAVDTKYQYFKLTTEVELLYMPVDAQTEQNETLAKPNKVLVTTIVPASLLLLGIIIALCLLKVCKENSRRDQYGLVSNQLNMEPTYRQQEDKDASTDGDKQLLFISELRKMYANKNLLSSCNGVPTENGMEILHPSTSTNKEWQEFGNYENILTLDCQRIIIEGRPGYGKSFLLYQFVDDWCKEKRESNISNVNILIILAMKTLQKTSSIYQAIKTFNLHADSKLTASDIEKILSECPSVVILFDGFDEYSYNSSRSGSDFMRIITGSMFQNFKVIVTTRLSHLPHEDLSQTTRIRLTGLGADSRNKYLQNIVAGGDNKSFLKIKGQLLQTPFYNELCDIPIFFNFFVHEYLAANLESLVTVLFESIISYLYKHMEKKMKEVKETTCDISDTENTLGRIALGGIRKDQFVWTKEELCKQMDLPLYEHYVSTGILVENPAVAPAGSSKIKTVQFFHNLFCSWYAAHRFAEYIADKAIEKDSTLSSLDIYSHHLVYRFACGINETVADKIISYLPSLQNSTVLELLCKCERAGLDKSTIDAIKYNYEIVEIAPDDSSFFKRFTIQGLMFASWNKIQISSLRLKECLSLVDHASGNLYVDSDICLPPLATLNCLYINDMTRANPLTDHQSKCLLHFFEMCPSLKSVWIFWCMMPKVVDSGYLSILQPRNVQVFWMPDVGSRYRLNLETGVWEDKKNLSAITDDAYEDLIAVHSKRHDKFR